MSFHSLVSSLISLHSVLQFSEYRSFTYWVRFIPRYSILFDAIVNGIVFLISLSISLLLLYRKATDFLYNFCCVLQLLPNSDISSSSFAVEYLGLFVYNIMSSANSDSLTSSLRIWIPCISLFCLIAVARTSGTMLNNSEESGHPCPVPDHRGNAFSFSLFSMMLAVGLSYMDFIMLRYLPSTPILLRVL